MELVISNLEHKETVSSILIYKPFLSKDLSEWFGNGEVEVVFVKVYNAEADIRNEHCIFDFSDNTLNFVPYDSDVCEYTAQKVEILKMEVKKV